MSIAATARGGLHFTQRGFAMFMLKWLETRVVDGVTRWEFKAPVDTMANLACMMFDAMERGVNYFTIHLENESDFEVVTNPEEPSFRTCERAVGDAAWLLGHLTERQTAELFAGLDCAGE